MNLFADNFVLSKQLKIQNTQIAKKTTCVKNLCI